MLRIENVEVFGWEAAIRGMRNPKNSWEKSDSNFSCRTCEGCAWEQEINVENGEREILLWCSHSPCMIGENDLKLMKTLAKAGSDHGKFLRMINVTLDITAPLYWWKEFDTYKVGTVANSCSTMHKIHDKKFTLDDFSHEHLLGGENPYELEDEATMYWDEDFEEYWTANDVLSQTVRVLNFYRDMHLRAKTKPMKEESKRAELVKRYWWQMIQLLPSSYNQKRTIQLNYEVLKKMYFARRNHKLDEWHTLCELMETLPYFKDICIQEE